MSDFDFPCDHCGCNPCRCEIRELTAEVARLTGELEETRIAAHNGWAEIRKVIEQQAYQRGKEEGAESMISVCAANPIGWTHTLDRYRADCMQIWQQKREGK